MKTQFSLHKYGFTMVELMVVIAIVWFLFVVFSRFSYQPQEHLARAERLANKISSVLHDGLLQITIGRMAPDPANPSLALAVTGAIVTIWTNNCTNLWGSGITWYYTPTLSWQIHPPIFDEDYGYEIESISATWGTTTGTGDCLAINIARDAISFSGTENLHASNTIVTITTKYLTMRKKVLFDRRTGRIEVNKN